MVFYKYEGLKNYEISSLQEKSKIWHSTANGSNSMED